MTTPAPVKIINCKYECGTKLGEFDQDAHKYKEVDTGELHTQDRCQEAKLNLAAKKSLEQKQTELSKQNEQKIKESKIIPTEPYAENIMKGAYVDHTKPVKGDSKLVIFFGSQPVDVEVDYNNFLRKNKDKIITQGAHDHTTFDNSTDMMMFSVYLYYEEKS